jgi:alkyl hydroperoxide reductase subunit AhpC
MTLAINDTAPDFEAQTTEGNIKFYDWIGDKWAVMFSHPKDFTPVCTTELGYMAKIKPEFDKRGVKIIGLSVDPVDRHAGWAADIKETQGFAPNYPMIADVDFNVSKLYGMLPAAASGDASKRARHCLGDIRQARVSRGGRPDQAHRGRQPDRAQCFRHWPGQESEAHSGLSDDHRP